MSLETFTMLGMFCFNNFLICTQEGILMQSQDEIPHHWRIYILLWTCLAFEGHHSPSHVSRIWGSFLPCLPLCGELSLHFIFPSSSISLSPGTLVMI